MIGFDLLRVDVDYVTDVIDVIYVTDIRPVGAVN